MALVIANAALQASEVIGMPEARILLAQAATYVACAPKSNAAYMGIDAALGDVRAKKTVAVPVHLQDSHYKGSERLGRGGAYKYAHEYEDGYVPQDYGVPRWTYYQPNDRGKEAEFLERLKAFEKRDQAAGRGDKKG
jgi:putative ATPase